MLFNWNRRAARISFSNHCPLRRFRPAVLALEDRITPSVLLDIANPNPAVGDQFGTAVAAVGSKLLVGAPSDNPGGLDNAGSVYLLNGTTGAVLLNIPNPNPAVGDAFGRAVANLNGNLAVGAPTDDVNGVGDVGAVYIFDGTTGALLLTISNPTPEQDDNFGTSLAVVNGNLVVGTPNDNAAGPDNAGAVYFFDGQTGALIRTIVHPQPQAAAFFGFVVAAASNNLLVGAALQDVGGVQDAGAAYFFDNNGNLLQILANPDPDTGDQFGGVVAAVNGRLVVTASSDDPSNVLNAGSVYLFYGTTGALDLAIPNPDPQVNDFFGTAVAGVGFRLVVGASGRDGVVNNNPANNIGAAFLFDATSGQFLQQIENPNPEAGDVFTSALAAVGNNILIGVSGDNPGNVTDAGSIVLFKPLDPGLVDLPFGDDGIVRADIDGVFRFNAVALQGDGKIVAVGRFADPSNAESIVARFNPNGSFDASFGVGGIASVFISTGSDFEQEPFAVAIQANGRIVVVGAVGFGPSDNQDIFVFRLSTNGSLDSDFDGDGIVVTNAVPGNDVASSIAIQSNGRILVAGTAHIEPGTGPDHDDFVILRYLTDGGLDTSFSTDGKQFVDFFPGAGVSDDEAKALAVKADGTIFVAGTTNLFGDKDFAVTALNSSGTVLTTFGGDGLVTTDFGGDEEASAMTLLTSGKIALAGSTTAGGGQNNFAVAQYVDASGALDTSFSNDGKVITDFAGEDDVALAIAAQTNGKLVVGGSASVLDPQIPSAALARYNTNGSLDLTFGDNGKATTALDGGELRGLAIQPDGKIVAVGVDFFTDFPVVVRYLGDPTPGITVTPVSQLWTTENGGTATFAVVLNTAPSANVTISVTSSDTTEGLVSTPNLVFTAGNALTPQFVTITGQNDFLIDGNIAYAIVLGAASSSDAAYNGLNPPDPTVTNFDNDKAGVSVTPNLGFVQTNEKGTDATFTIVLNAIPTANVTIALSSSDTGEGVPAVASVTFTPANALTPQTVTITHVDDLIFDGDINYHIALAPASSADTNYNGLNSADVLAVNIDDEEPTVTVSPLGSKTSESGDTATLSVVLNGVPTDSVTVTFQSNNPAEGTLSVTQLTFLPANALTPQFIAVTGVDDDGDDGNILYTISTLLTVSADPNFDGLTAPDVFLTNFDNDPPPDISMDDVSVAEGDAGTLTATFTVSLSRPSTQPVTVHFATEDGTATGGQDFQNLVGDLTFDPNQTTKSITVTVNSDVLKENDEDFTVRLTNAVNANITDDTGTGTIVNDEGPATVKSITINDGSAQRSMVNGITVTFSEIVIVPSGAITLKQKGATAVPVTANSQIVGGRTVTHLTFNGPGIIGNSLADGNFTLTLKAGKIRDLTNLKLDGNADGKPGGNRKEKLFRFFGDSNGDRRVDTTDANLFQTTLGKTAADAAFLAFFDADADGDVDADDQTRFNLNLGKALLP